MLSPGSRIGPYEVVSSLGAGGMGEVYRARDTKLHRDVALKVLPESFAGDADRLSRFEREAHLLASLNHPHIAAIYGLEDGPSSAGHALILELIDGDTLADRLARGPLPIDEALPIARQIAEALEFAHDHGVIHRDLKPANIKITPSGKVKVLDFGLAKLIEGQGGAGGPGKAGRDEVMNSPTLASPVTMGGVILGTAPYMSPEQARGRAVDRSADAWAFGCVLYEMLTGKRAFGPSTGSGSPRAESRGDGSDVTDTIVAIVSKEPDWSALPAQTPSSIRRLLRRTLEKDASRRLSHLSAARLDIDDAVGSSDAAAITETPSGPTPWRLAAAVGVIAFASGLAGALLLPRTSAPTASAPVPLFAQIAAPAGALSAFFDGFALSPDGDTLAFTVRDATGARQIWTRPIGALTGQPVRGTERGRYPMWSPDGKHLAFFADGKLRRVSAEGGQPQVICDVTDPRFTMGSWGASDTILFTAIAFATGSMYRVPASGGTATALESLGPGVRPIWLPDGRRFLYSKRGGSRIEVRMATIDAAESSVLLEIESPDASYSFVAPDLLLFNQNDALVVQRFNVDDRRLIGKAVPIAGLAGSPKGWFAVSGAAGRVAAFVRESSDDPGSAGDPMSRLQWVNRDGDLTTTLGPPGRYWTMRLAPDGRRAVVNMAEELWIVDEGGRRVRLTSGRQAVNASWSADGKEVVYTRGRLTMRQAASPGAKPTTYEKALGLTQDWSRDGRSVAVEIPGGIGIYDIQAQTLRSVVESPFETGHPRFAPDGRWLAYTSKASGRVEVYVTRVDGPDAPVLVSTAGGMHPVWRGDGRELFFLAEDGAMMAVDIDMAAGRVTFGRPKTLFRIPMNDLGIEFFAPYDVASDGQRFLLNVPDRPEPLLFLQGLDALVK